MTFASCTCFPRCGGRAMNKRQEEDLIKLLYEIIKYTYTGFIIGGIIEFKGLRTKYVLLGIGLSSLFYIFAFWLSRKEA